MNALSNLRPKISEAESLKGLQVVVGELRVAIIEHAIPDNLLPEISNVHDEIMRQAGKLRDEEFGQVANLFNTVSSASHGLIGLARARQEAKNG